MSGVSDVEYAHRRAVEKLNADMKLIERERRRANACDHLSSRLSRDQSEKVTISAMGRIKAWLRPSRYSTEDTAQMQLTDDEVEQLRGWLSDQAYRLREHASAVERKWAGVE